MAPERAMEPTSAVGPLLENFAVGEIARQLTWADEPLQLFHYRDRDKIEVDAVLEHASGDLVGVEIKAAETVRRDDFHGLRHLQSRPNVRFLGRVRAVFRAGIAVVRGSAQGAAAGRALGG